MPALTDSQQRIAELTTLNQLAQTLNRALDLREALDSGRVGGAGLDVLEDERVFRKTASGLITDQIVESLHADPVSPEERHQRDPERLEELRTLGRNEALLARPDVIFTPHVAFNSVEAVERIDHVTIENICAFVAGRPINTITG